MLDSYVTDEFVAIRKTPSEYFRMGNWYKLKARIMFDAIQVRVSIGESYNERQEIGMRYDNITRFLDDWGIDGYAVEQSRWDTKEGMIGDSGIGWTADEASRMISRAFGGKRKIDEIALDVIRGRYGVGEARRIALGRLNVDYEAVQKRVNEMLADKKKKEIEGRDDF